MHGIGGRVARAIGALVPLEPGERAPALWSAGLSLCALSSFYVLRPVRDELGAAGGVEGLPWLFTATFVAMLLAVPIYGRVVARTGRRRIVPRVYRFCALVLLGFVAAFALAEGEAQAWVGRAYFVWAAVFNLLVVSVAWQLMADVWRREQGERVFGLVAAGGSVGGLLGPALTFLLARPLGTAGLVLVAALLLEGAIACARGLLRSIETGSNKHVSMDISERPVGGGALAAFALIARSRLLRRIALWMVLLTTTATFAYFEQARIVKAAIADRAGRTELFASIDFAVNALSAALQGLAVGRLMPRIGVGWTLAILPLVTLVGFSALAGAPLLAVLVGFQVVRRAADFSLAKPAREVLYTLAGREARYKAKQAIDT
ncbi:MAG TPA: MFS transporter, partial [Nannocystis sp.]